MFSVNIQPGADCLSVLGAGKTRVSETKYSCLVSAFNWCRMVERGGRMEVKTIDRPTFGFGRFKPFGAHVGITYGRTMLWSDSEDQMANKMNCLSFPTLFTQKAREACPFNSTIWDIFMISQSGQRCFYKSWRQNSHLVSSWNCVCVILGFEPRSLHRQQ